MKAIPTDIDGDIEFASNSEDRPLHAQVPPQKLMRGAGRRTRRSPERQALRDNRARLGKEIAQLHDIPPMPHDEPISPKRGKLLKRAMEPAVQESMGPMKYKLFLILCAYADAGEPSPVIKALAARMSTTVPNTLYLLYALENKGRLRVEWSSDRGGKNKYELIWRDGE